LRLVVADETFLFREAVVAVLQSEPDIEVLAAFGDYHDLREAIVSLEPDVVVTDVRMPPTHTDEGIRAATELRASRPAVGVVVLTQDVDSRYVLELFREGSEGRAYLLKDRVRDRDAIVGAVRAVARGESAIDPKVVELLISSRERENSPLADLSPREREILREIATGKANVAIAETLHVSKRSVEKHIHAIFRKLGLIETDDVSPRVKAALIFLAEESVDPRAAADRLP
jgi:DNA-binding NarL/FixJ family response regulator